MQISANSQLGLMLFEQKTMLQLCEDSQFFLDSYKQQRLKQVGGDYDLVESEQYDGTELFKEIMHRIGYNPELKGSEFYTVKHPNPIYFLIMSTVERCAEMIRVNENFSCSIFNKIKDGDYTYLLGKNEFYHFVKFNGVIRAFFWNKERRVAFELGFHLEKNRYYFPNCEMKEFNRLVRLMIFIELGDIEMVELKAGRSNGKPKKDGKIINQSNNTVYVVDSSWNKLIIRTDGFAVRGHFRLQPCGVAMADRKLMWINAFEKHGYTRRPKAEIIK